ncbi:MAG: sensor histidine kinase [Candidatus Dormibacteria bacterium]
MAPRSTPSTTRSRPRPRFVAEPDVRSVLLDTAAHELRTPLTVLSGYLSMLGDGSFGALPPAANDVLGLLSTKTEELNHVVDDILDVVRFPSASEGAGSATADVGAEVAAVVAEWRPLTGPEQELRFVPPPSRVTAAIDSRRLRTIVTNLVTNAIKYTLAGEIVVATSSTAEAALVTVRDHGCGIRPEDADTAFTRLGRLGDARERPGMGLGLYIARELARLHGGDITLRSEAGRGSTFTVSLPLAVAGSA